MVNLVNLKQGQRIKLLSELVNENSSWKPKEDIPVGTMGTVVWPCDERCPVEMQSVGIAWDTGSRLGILPHDNVEVVLDEQVQDA
jgi:hypothetical protein